MPSKTPKQVLHYNPSPLIHIELSASTPLRKLQETRQYNEIRFIATDIMMSLEANLLLKSIHTHHCYLSKIRNAQM